MSGTIPFETKEDRFARQWMEAKARDEARRKALTEAKRRELTMIGKAAYADLLAQRAKEKAMREAEQAENEKAGIQKIISFPGK